MTGQEKHASDPENVISHINIHIYMFIYIKPIYIDKHIMIFFHLITKMLGLTAFQFSGFFFVAVKKTLSKARFSFCR